MILHGAQDNWVELRWERRLPALQRPFRVLPNRSFDVAKSLIPRSLADTPNVFLHPPQHNLSPALRAKYESMRGFAQEDVPSAL